MSKTATMSSTLAFAEGVDLESINKGKASRVDVKKLEKQEAKLRAKIEKRARRPGGDLYEGSKLLKDFLRVAEGSEEVRALRTEVRAFARKWPLPGVDVSNIVRPAGIEEDD